MAEETKLLGEGDRVWRERTSLSCQPKRGWLDGAIYVGFSGVTKLGGRTIETHTEGLVGKTETTENKKKRFGNTFSHTQKTFSLTTSW